LRRSRQAGRIAGVGETCLYLVCGLPGAGKTTRSHQIVERVRAVHLSPDEWVVPLGVSLVDYEFRIKLQGCMLAHAQKLLRCGLSVVIEFGSWSRHERETIRKAAETEGASTELHFLNAPLEELMKRVRARGGPEAETLAAKILFENSEGFEQSTPDEIASFDRYCGPNDVWAPR
jgi:predicted kinase